MDKILVTAGLAGIALVFFVAERCISLFTWSRLEGLTSVTRARRQRIEDCLEERELVATCFSVCGCTTLAVATMLFCVFFREKYSATLVVEIAAAALVLVWLLPEIAAWAVRDRIVLYLVPALYRVAGIPFAKLRHITGQAGRSITEGARRDVERSGNGIGATTESETEAEAYDLFREAVRLQHNPVREIMTPRTDMVSIAHAATLRETAQACMESGNSRLPVYRGNRDQIIGIVHVKDLLAFAATEKWDQSELEGIMRPPVFVPETKTISELLEEFKRSNTHMGIVLDEYGGTAGLVTLEDMLEELIGEIHDEHESAGEEAPPYVWTDSGELEVQAVMHVEEFNEEFNLDLPEQEDFDTLGGLVTFIMGKIPVTGETFRHGSARFTVIEADVRHVIRLRVTFDKDTHVKEKD